jgi:hypothetical protein
MGVVVESEERGPDGRVQGKGISKILKKDLKSKMFHCDRCFTMAQGGGLKARLYHNPFSSPLGS